MGLTLERSAAAPPTTATTAAEPSSTTGALARGKGYAAGKAALSPDGAKGSALVAGGSQTTEEARSNGITARLTETLASSPSVNLDDAIAVARTRVAQAWDDQHATVTTVGNQGERAKGKGRKHAVFMANAHYKDTQGFLPLEETVSEAQALEGALATHGYTSHGIRVDSTAAEMKRTAAIAALGTGVAPGDHVVIHYGGHGLTAGLVGHTLDAWKRIREDAITDSAIPGDDGRQLKPVAESMKGATTRPGLDENDFLPYEALEGIARTAVSKGVHVSMILDACHSGVAADLVRSRRDFKADGSTQDTTGPESGESVAAAASGSRALSIGTKLALVGIVRAWQADQTAARREGEPGKASRMAEVDARYFAALQQLWQEFLAARFVAIEAELHAKGRAMGAAPAMPATMGKLGDVLAWLDRSYEALAVD